jgi:hypothetical protein
MSTFVRRYGATQTEFFDFGTNCPGGPCYHIITLNEKIELFLNGPSPFGPNGDTIQPLTTVCFNENVYNHIFVNFSCAGGGKIWVNGAQVASFPNLGVLGTALTALFVGGYGIIVPPPYNNGTLDYCNFQVWWGQAIDPSATGTVPGPLTMLPLGSQPPIGGKAVSSATWSLMAQVVNAAEAAGVDPVIALTIMNIESAYGTNLGTSSTFKGIYQFDQAEMNTALGPPPSKKSSWSLTDNVNQENTFDYYMTTPTSNNWFTPAIQSNFGTDPTGLRRYTVYNQGASGAASIWAAPAGATIGSLPAPIPGDMVAGVSIGKGKKSGGQAWANTAPALTTNSLVSDWLSRLNSFYAAAQADAKSRTTSSTAQNINAFRTSTGGSVDPSIPASLFGKQDILFTGNSLNFQTNAGTAGAFTFSGPALIDVSPPP